MGDSDVETLQAPAGGFIVLGDPDLAETLGRIAGELTTLSWELYRKHLEDMPGAREKLEALALELGALRQAAPAGLMTPRRIAPTRP